MLQLQGHLTPCSSVRTIPQATADVRGKRISLSLGHPAAVLAFDMHSHGLYIAGNKRSEALRWSDCVARTRVASTCVAQAVA